MPARPYTLSRRTEHLYPSRPSPPRQDHQDQRVPLELILEHKQDPCNTQRMEEKRYR